MPASFLRFCPCGIFPVPSESRNPGRHLVLTFCMNLSKFLPLPASCLCPAPPAHPGADGTWDSDARVRRLWLRLILLIVGGITRARQGRGFQESAKTQDCQDLRQRWNVGQVVKTEPETASSEFVSRSLCQAGMSVPNPQKTYPGPRATRKYRFTYATYSCLHDRARPPYIDE